MYVRLLLFPVEFKAAPNVRIYANVEAHKLANLEAAAHEIVALAATEIVNFIFEIANALVARVGGSLLVVLHLFALRVDER